MEIRIENDDDFRAKIDQFGDAQAKIKALQEDLSLLKQMLESYAKRNGIKTLRTDSYRLRMKPGKPSLRRTANMSEDAVIALLKSSEMMKAYVCETYDSDGIKAMAEAMSDCEDYLAEFGLFLSATPSHAEVKPL